VLVNEVMDQALFDPVGKASGVKSVLQPELRVIKLRQGRSL
jgi:hypothetical protein